MNAETSSERGKTIWAFDLGKGSIGEAVRCGDKFLHKASLLIPADFARRGPATVSGTPANRYRAMKTREAHHERERWLDIVWVKASFTPLAARKVWENPKIKKWELKHKADYRLEREFPPSIGEKTNDGAPSDKAGTGICYTSCLLRIRLLQHDNTLTEATRKRAEQQKRAEDFTRRLKQNFKPAPFPNPPKAAG